MMRPFLKIGISPIASWQESAGMVWSIEYSAVSLVYVYSMMGDSNYKRQIYEVLHPAFLYK